MEDMTNSKKHYSPERKANLAIQAIRGEDKINQLASLNQIHPNQIKRWKKQLKPTLRSSFPTRESRKTRAKKI